MLRMLTLSLAITLVACGPGTAGPAGPPGPQGEAGAPGEAGPAGAPGAGLLQATRCSADRVLVGNYTMSFVHERYDFADGSLLASCGMLNAGPSYWRTSMYRAGEIGGQEARCVLGFDVDATNATYGSWAFQVARGGASGEAVYSDPGSQYHGIRVALACTSS